MNARAAPALHADWPAPSRVRAFTTLRSGAGASSPPFDSFNLGDRCGDDPAAVAANRAASIARFGLPSAPRWLRQVHGIEVARFDGKLQDEEPQADAAATSAPGLVLAVLTADCLPVVLAAADGSEVAVAHAGWRGLASGVMEATAAAMRTPSAALIAWLGPAAGPQAYEVGQEVFDAFVLPDGGAAAAFVVTRPRHWRMDLYALARRRLAACGVTRVSGGGLCTISDPERFYSHRRDRRTGRMATLVWLEEGGA